MNVRSGLVGLHNARVAVAPPIYLDHAATTPLEPAVLEAMLPFLRDDWGNASSVHSAGRAARNGIDDARDTLAKALGAQPREIIFTSGGSEADNLAVRGVADMRGGGHIITSAIEHEAVLATCEMLRDMGRIDLTIIGCDGAGRVDPAEVADAVRDDTILVSVMLANNEVGTVQEIAEMSRLVKERNATTLMHTDAVQGFGKLDVNAEALGADMLALSAHKIGGPKGVGALYMHSGVRVRAQMSGGGQERGRRSGTENVAGIVGFAAAATLALQRRDADTPRLRELSRRLSQIIIEAVPDVMMTGSALHRLPNIASFAVPGVATEVLLTSLDGDGVCASGGSACSSGATVASHVLEAMGVAPQVAKGALRLSMGHCTTDADVDAAAAAVIQAISRARAAAAARAARSTI